MANKKPNKKTTRKLKARRAKSKVKKRNPSRFTAELQAAIRHYHAGQLGIVESICRKIIDTEANNAVAHNLMGATYQRIGQLQLAIIAYEKAIDSDPSLQNAFLNLGNTYVALNRNEEAINNFNQAIQLDPTQHAAYEALGSQYRRIGLFDNMVDTYRRAKSALPDYTPFQIGLADAFERISDLDSAELAIEQVLDKTPNDIDALRVWARIKRRRGALKEARDRLSQVEISNAQPMQATLHHAELGLIYDRLDDVDNAYRHFVMQNDLMAKRKPTYKTEKANYLDMLNSLHELYDSSEKSCDTTYEASDNVNHAGPPVFLLGFPRSGTTLLDQILDSHPQVMVLEERPLLLKLRNALVAKTPGYPNALKILSATDISELRHMYWQAMEAEGADLISKTVINKLPLNIIHIELIRTIFPEARIILALRHPCDCVLSCFMQNFTTNGAMANFLNLKDAAKLYSNVMALWQKYAEPIAHQVVEVRYENLIQNLKKEVEPVIDHLGLDWDDALLDHVSHATARGTINTPSYAQVTEPLYGRSIARWRRYEKHLEPCLEILRPHIEQFGYDL